MNVNGKCGLIKKTMKNKKKKMKYKYRNVQMCFDIQRIINRKRGLISFAWFVTNRFLLSSVSLGKLNKCDFHIVISMMTVHRLNLKSHSYSIVLRILNIFYFKMRWKGTQTKWIIKQNNRINWFLMQFIALLYLISCNISV